MPSTIALLVMLLGALAVGLIVFFTGMVQIVSARRRTAPVRAPVIATGIGFVFALVAAITLMGEGALHLTTETYLR